MSTSGSVETPDFAAPAETNTGSENTNLSAGSILTERRSVRSAASRPISWSTINTMMGEPMNEEPTSSNDRSRHRKRAEEIRRSGASKSPRRDSQSRGPSRMPLTADQRLDALIMQHRNRTPRGGEQLIGGNLVGSPLESPVSPSVAAALQSPPRELTRPQILPEAIPINEVTSDETGFRAIDYSRDTRRESDLNQEVVALTQRQLTSEFEVAEMNNLRAESEISRRNIEQELSQEVHMFNQARELIEEMRRSFTIEDQGCIRRIEMLERQRNEYATGMFELGNQAESLLHERHAEYSEEIQRVKNLAEAHVGKQDEDIVRLRRELNSAHLEMSASARKETEIHREALVRNEFLSNELLNAKSSFHRQENELSLMKNSMNERSAIYHSEISNLQAMVKSQNELQLQHTGFTEDEIRAYIMKKITQAENECNQESMVLKAMIQSEIEVAKKFERRYESIAQHSIKGDPLAEHVISTLMDRLRDEQIDTEHLRRRKDESDREAMELRGKCVREEHELEKTEVSMKSLRNLMDKNQQKNNEMIEYNANANATSRKPDELIEFLESEVERLREGRDEECQYNQQLWEEINEQGDYWNARERRDPFEEVSEIGHKDHDESRPRISRREADKIVVPPWPKSRDLDGWKSQLLSNVLSACADSDQDAWIAWLSESFKINPSIEKMSDSGGSRFSTIDVKLANALNAMITSSGDSGREVGLEIKVMTLDLARSSPPKVMKGRQIIAMILESFRSSTHTDLTFTGKHLHELTYPGDAKLNLFRNQWIHLLSAMREDDKPRDMALRDTLFDKIRGSTSMQFEIWYYRSLPEGHTEKTYEYLMNMMARTIATEREEKNRIDKAKGIRELLGAKALAAEKPPKNDNKPKNDKTKENSENNALPVLTKPSPKSHGEKGKGKDKSEKGKGKGKRDKSKGRSQSQDKKSIPCVFYFQKGGCSRGKECLYSHAEKHGPRANSQGPGNGKGGDGPRNGRSSSPMPKNEKPCFLFAKGKCDRADCPYKHDSDAAPAETGSAKAKASPKGKAKAAAAKAKAAAVVVEVGKGYNEDYIPDWSDSEDPSPVAASRHVIKRSKGHARKDKVVKIKRDPERIMINVEKDPKGLPKRNSGRTSDPRVVKKDFLDSETFKHQSFISHLVARARAQVLNKNIMGNKSETKVMIGNGVHINVKWKSDRIIEDMVKTTTKRLKRVEGTCVSANTSGKSVRFIMDTGCGHDLISQRKVKELGLETYLDNDGMTFMTANGLTDSNEITMMDHESLGQCKLHVLNQTPAVLSVGSRCTKEGYSFVWPDGEDMKPVMIGNDGTCTFLEVDGDIPYLIPGLVPDSNTIEESKNRLLSFLETLIQRIKNGGENKIESKPKATAGESVGDDEYEPTEAGEEAENVVASDGEDPHKKDDEAVPEGDKVPASESRPEDPEGLIEVEVERGESRYAKPGTLKREAKTLDHLMTHRYSNPFCDSCIRAKMRHFKTRKGAFKRKLSKFGDLIAFDFVDMGKATEMGWRDHKELLVIRDRYSGMVLGSPVPDKSTETVVLAIKKFVGERKVVCAYSDSAPSFEAAMNELGIPLDKSLPGRSVTNSIAERNNLFMLDTASTCLLHAGLPACFWPFAVEYVSHALNIERLEDGSAWEKMHKEAFKGKMIPFGAKVNFKPSEARKAESPSKFSPRSIPGVFAGYEISTGMKWSRKMLVWSMATMSTINLPFDLEKVPLRAIDPHVTEVVVMVEPIEFPLKDLYEKTNGTIEGLRDRDNDEIEDEEEDEGDGGDDQDNGDDGEDKKPNVKGKDKKDEPKLLHYSEGIASDGIIYVNDIGDEVKLDSKGRPYRVGSDGRKLMPSKRPVGYITPEEWAKMSAKEKEASTKAADEIAREEVEKEDRAAKKKRKKDKKEKKKESRTYDDSELKELEDMFDAVAQSEAEGRSSESKDKATPSILQSDDDISTDGEGSYHGSEPYPEEWLEWEEFVCHQEGPCGTSSDGSKVTYEALICLSEDVGIAASSERVKKMKVEAPSMPCIPSDEQHSHREKIPNIQSPFPAAVSRPVSRKEMLENPEALKKMRDEWNGLTEQGTFEFGTSKEPLIYEYDEMRAIAKTNDEEIHFGRVHGIMVEKHWQLPKDDPRRKFKGRAVLLGNKVTNQNIEAAFFQDLGNSPATFEAARWADLYGLLPKNSVTLADAIRAYIQADLKGPRFFVELPPEAWPTWVNLSKYRRPVVRLRKALYGHPDSGTMWEQHCDKAVKSVGFVAVGPEWPSTYYHKEMELLLVVYVDDLKMAGPQINIKKGWDLLRSKLDLEPETDLGLYLGCQLARGSTKLKDGTTVSTITYDMESFLEQSVQKYLEIIGTNTVLKKVPTPSLPEEAKDHPARAPCGTGPVSQCTWCGTIHPVTEPTKSKSTPSDNSAQKSGNTIVKGELAPHAASVLMKLLYAARIARFDLLRSINMLARNVTKWTKEDDIRLHHLRCYVSATKSQKLIGWVGNDLRSLQIGIFADADYAGCGQSLRSTSGSHMMAFGSHTRFPLAGGSKRQGCVSHSTPEAEIIAADYALRTHAIPLISLWKTLVQQDPKIVFP